MGEVENDNATPMVRLPPGARVRAAMERLVPAGGWLGRCRWAHWGILRDIVLPEGAGVPGTCVGSAWGIQPPRPSDTHARSPRCTALRGEFCRDGAATRWVPIRGAATPASRRVLTGLRPTGCPVCDRLARALAEGEAVVCTACGWELVRPVPRVPGPAARASIGGLLRALRALRLWLDTAPSGIRGTDLSGVVGTGCSGSKGAGRVLPTAPPRVTPPPPARARLHALRGSAAHRVCAWVLYHGLEARAIQAGPKSATLSLEASCGYALGVEEDRRAWAAHLALGYPTSVRLVEQGASEVGRVLLLSAARVWFGLAPAGAGLEASDPRAELCPVGPAARCHRSRAGVTVAGVAVEEPWRPTADEWELVSPAWLTPDCACCREAPRTGRWWALRACASCGGSGRLPVVRRAA